MKKRYLLPLLFFGLLFSQCRKEETISHSQPVKPNTSLDKGKSILADFSGQIINEFNNAVANASVVIGDKTALTNSNGFFFIRDAAVNENFAYASVNAVGHFHGSRTVLPKSGVNQIKITLLSNAIRGSFPASQGGKIEVGKATIQFGVGYTKANGIPYSGRVNVAMKYLDPEADNLNEIMPGDLLASSTTGSKLLESYGMVAVELKDDAGNKLQLAEGNEAVIHMGLSPNVLSKAPNSLPLWYFDEERGIWIEEGKAELINGEYIGSVKHFSFWNCDVPRDYNRIDGIVKTSNGYPIAGLSISLTSKLIGTGKCYTSSQGEYGGRVPSGETFNLSVSYLSKSKFKTMTIGPFSSDQKIPDIIIDDLSDLVKIEGSAIDCNGDPVLKGLLFINDQTPIDINSGTYSFYMPKSTAFTVRYYDYLSAMYTKNELHNGYLSNQNWSSKKICDAGSGGGGNGKLTYEISYRIDGVLYLPHPITPTAFGYYHTMDYIKLTRYHQKDGVNIGDIRFDLINYNGPGNYTVRNENRDSAFFGDYYSPTCTGADSLNLIVNEYFIASAPGNNVLIDLEFSGTVKVWNEQKQLFEKKNLTEGIIKASQ